jgi:type IV secretion system protein VirB2
MGRIGWHVFIGALATNGRLRSLAGALISFRKRRLETFAAFPIETSLVANDGFWCHADLHFTPGRVTMTSIEHRSLPRSSRAGILAGAIAAPGIVCAQASPFLTGATALQSNILAWLTPIAIILVMVLGAMAMANRMSWGWCLGAIFGIAIAFGAPQIVTWVRGMFGV